MIACTFLFFTLIPFIRAQNKVDAQWKEVNGTNIPIPPNEHPRLYLRSHDIPELKERLSDPDLKDVWKKLMEMKNDWKPEEFLKKKGGGFMLSKKG